MKMFMELADDPIKVDRLLLFLNHQFENKKNITINSADLYFLTPTVIAVNGFSFVYIFNEFETISINKTNKVVYKNTGRFFQVSLFCNSVFISLFKTFKDIK